MQVSESSRFGVSPAFLLSGYGESFGPDDVESALPRIAALEFQTYQPEVFDATRFDDWTRAAVSRVATAARETGIAASAFVAHFFGVALASEAELKVEGDAARRRLAVFDRVLELAAELGAPAVVVPALPFVDRPGSRAELWPLIVGFFAELLDRAEAAGSRLAVETVPGSLIPTTTVLERLDRDLGGGRIGYLCDTGNALAAGESPVLAVKRMAGSIVATHICDSRPGGGSSDCPGTGAVSWPETLAELDATGYTGSLDIEIRCAATDVEALYTQARGFLTTVQSETVPAARGRIER